MSPEQAWFRGRGPAVCAVVPWRLWGQQDTGRDSGDVTLSAIPRLGCGSLDYRQQAQQIELKTGGMSAAPHVLPDNSQLDTYEQVGPTRRGRLGACSAGWFSVDGVAPRAFCLCCYRVCCVPLSAWTGTSRT